MNVLKGAPGSLWAGVKRLDDFLANAEGWVVSGILALMILLAFLQVVLRNVFSFGFAWVEELLRVSVLWVGFVGASLAIKQGRHINIDVLSRTIPTRYKPILQAVMSLVLLGVCLIFLYASVEYIRVEKEFGDVSDQLHTPVWVLQLIFPLLFGVGSFRLLVQTVENLRTLRSGRRP